METETQPASTTPSISVVTTTTPVAPVTQETSLNQEIQELYSTLSSQIGLMVTNGNFEMESLEIIMGKTVDVIEAFNARRATPLSGQEKRAIGLSLVKMVLDDLHTRGIINDQLYQSFNMSLVYMAPMLFYAAKVAWTKLQEVSEDINTKGVRGCCTRNFCKK